MDTGLVRLRSAGRNRVVQDRNMSEPNVSASSPRDAVHDRRPPGGNNRPSTAARPRTGYRANADTGSSGGGAAGDGRRPPPATLPSVGAALGDTRSGRGDRRFGYLPKPAKPKYYLG